MAEIRKSPDKVDWINISANQKLSEAFIREFKDKVDWNNISYSQPWTSFSQEFQDEFKDKLTNKENHIKISDAEKLKQIKTYAKEYKLKFDGKYLFAFRNHDIFGRGIFNKTIFYESGETYTDWHCDMNPKNKDSFGLGIFPEGNTKVKVHYQDWVIAVNREDGKARVWKFTVL